MNPHRLGPPAEIRVEIGTLSVPAGSGANLAERLAEELRRQLGPLLADSSSSGGLRPGHRSVSAQRAGRDGMAAAVHRAIVAAGGAQPGGGSAGESAGESGGDGQRGGARGQWGRPR